MIKDQGWHSLQERRTMSGLTLMYKRVHGLVNEDSSEVANSGRATRRSTSQRRFRNITANKNCYRSSFFPRTAPEWNHLRSTHPVETIRAQMAQEINIADLISRSHYYYNCDDCWPLQHLSTVRGNNSRRPRFGQKPRVRPAMVWLLITLFYKKHFFILNYIKDKK